MHAHARSYCALARIRHAHGARHHTTLRYTAPTHRSDWVDSLPEPTKSEKEAYIIQFGSPNVFTQFDPHVTVGYGEYGIFKTSSEHTPPPRHPSPP